ncbi:MAG TPA: metalloregulator ArsR/SmtB family transcription factor [Candidatus Atopostipes pullistercoris]|uniref:Metalloregulator ArsR/SmtB family transcription factor n=1 Tax=Candidatus Atopostipes pullistercoris TaxID=2838467 RepID=A0A9D2G3R4_9LACT|nr:metalloregulator ArsR/SmtB family transcription factor [Candidatus Atopostipes pullistercoris]
MSKERELKDSLYQEFARIGKSLSSPKRLELLDLLSQGPKSVEELSKATTMSVANVSQHLQTLFKSKLVTSHKKGNYVIYELMDEVIVDFLKALHTLSEKQYMEVQQIKQAFINENQGLNDISLEELNERMEEGEILLLDVRPKTEYESNHIPGAISVPMDELTERISSLPKNKEIVAYCRGTYCLMSTEAVKLLNDRGLEASRLQKSVQDWHQYQSEHS